METLYLVLSQLVFSFSRTLNVRYTSRDMAVASIITSTVIKSAWLVSAYLGINAIINQDWITAVVFVISGVVGDCLSFKIKMK